MDKYSKVEKLLKNYKMMKISIENIEEEIDFTKNDITIDGISYDKTPTSPTHKISSIVENTVLAKVEKIQYLERCIKKNRMDIGKIDRALDGLEEIEKIVIVEKYINNKQWWQVASKVCYSEGHTRRIRKDAINKLVKGILG